VVSPGPLEPTVFLECDNESWALLLGLKRNVFGVIAGNRVVQVSGLPISGAVSDDGNLVASYHSDMGLSLHADGRVAGMSGSGAWRSSPGFCSGTWRARRNDVAHAKR
jgi:hypothetical protein